MRILPLILLAAGCAAEVDLPLDGDADGLLSTEEEQLGTDPDNPDSDGDGHADGIEFESGTDPLSPDDHPYTGGWPMDKGCRDGHEPTGNEVGDITDAFGGIDQYEEQFDSMDFCGKVLIVEFGAFW